MITGVEVSSAVKVVDSSETASFERISSSDCKRPILRSISGTTISGTTTSASTSSGINSSKITSSFTVSTGISLFIVGSRIVVGVAVSAVVGAISVVEIVVGTAVETAVQGGFPEIPYFGVKQGHFWGRSKNVILSRFWSF